MMPWNVFYSYSNRDAELRDRQYLALLLMSVLIALGIVGSSSRSHAELAAQKEALDLITETAERICRSPSTEGHDASLELTGAAKVELNKTLARLAGLGIEGAAKYKQSKYENVLQKDLAGVIRQATDCRRDIATKLIEKLLPSPSSIPDQPSPPGGHPPQSNSGALSFAAADFPAGSLIPSPHRATSAIIEGRGLTSDSDTTAASVHFRGFTIKCPCEVKVVMSRCGKCEVGILAGSTPIASVTTGFYGTHGNVVEFAGRRGEAHSKSSEHRFLVGAEGVRYYLNGAFVALQGRTSSTIDEVVVRGLKREHPNVGRSYLGTVSAYSVASAAP